VKLWDVATGQERLTLDWHLHTVWAVAFAPDGETLATGSEDKTVRLWNVATGRERAVFWGHQDLVAAAAFARDGRTLATGSHDGTVKLWDLVTGRERATLLGHTRAVKAAAFSADGRTLLTTGPDRTIKRWEMAARISQIMNLLGLAPDLQEALLFLPRVTRGRDPLHLRQLQPIAATLDWQHQRRRWRALLHPGTG
jgi:WD40 repeat protein